MPHENRYVYLNSCVILSSFLNVRYNTIKSAAVGVRDYDVMREEACWKSVISRGGFTRI